MKRLTAIILAAIILLSSFEPIVAAEKSTTENKKIKWMLENNFIVGRGQTKDLKLEDTITRAEFTRMVLVAKGEENLAKEDSTSKADFKDVPNTHWAEKFIAYAKQKGYISGYPDGNFRPEGEITYEEMISILARIHPNYRKIEAKSTNWAEGFINFARDNGILDDINIKGSYKSPAIREKTFEMTYNFIKFVENQTKSEKVSKAKEEKDVNKESSTWNGFYPYWLGYGFRPIVEEKPEVKPNPDVKPAPDKPEKENPGAETPKPGTEPETPSEPETPKEFDKTKIDKIKIVSQPSKLEYTEGEKLDLSGIKLKLTDTQGKDKEIVLEDFSEYGITTDPSVGASLTTNENGTTIKIKLHGEVKVETDLLIVNQKVFDPENLKTITVKTQPTKLSYTEGEKLNLSGLEVTLTDNQGLTKDVAFADFAANGIEAAPANETALTLTDNEKKVKLTKGNLTAETEALTVKAKAKFIEVTDTVSPIPEGYERLTFDATADGKIGNAQVKAFDVLKGTTYDDAELKAKIKEVVAVPTDSKKEFKGWKPEIPTGTETVATKIYEAEYKSKEIDKNNITKVEVIAPPTKLNYVVGESLSLDGLKVRLTDNQGVTEEIGSAKFNAYGITTKPKNETKLTTDDNGKEVVISREDKKAITGNISLKLRVISQDDFEKENKIKTNIKNSLVEVYKNLGDLKLGVDNIQNKYYLLFTKDASEIIFDKENLKKSILATIKKNKIKSYSIGETTRVLTQTDDEILRFIREDILKIAGLEGTQDATDAQILEKLKTTKPNTKIKLVFEDGNVSREFDYEIIFLTQMADEKLNQIEADFAKHMQETSKIVENENKGYRVSYNNKYYFVEHKFEIRTENIVYLATEYRYDIVLTNFLTGENLGKSKSLKELKSFMVHTIRRSKDIDNRGIMDSMELQILLDGGNYREITESYHGTFRGPNKSLTLVAENLESTETSLEYFYTDEVSETGGIITRTIYYRYY